EVSWVVHLPYNDGRPFLQVGRSIGKQDAYNDYPSEDWIPNPKANPKLPQPIQSRIFANNPIPGSAPESNWAMTDSQDKANIAASPMKVSIHHSKAEGGQWQVFINDDS